MRHHVPKWVWITVASIAAVVVVAGGITWGKSLEADRASNAARWADFPHAMTCVQDRFEPDPSDGPLPADAKDLHLPDAARVTTATVTHLDGDRLRLSLQFLEAAPVAPKSFVSPFTGQSNNQPGSLTYFLTIQNGQGRDSLALFIDSPTYDKPDWHFTPDDRVPEEANRNILQSANTHGKVVDLVLDLEGQNRVLGDNPFRPEIDVDANTIGLPDRTWPNGTPRFIDGQRCEWDNTPADQKQGNAVHSPPDAEVPPSRGVPAPGSGGWGFPSPSEVVPSPNSGGWAFQSPTGNIVCHMGPTGAACDIREYHYAVPPPPSADCRFFGDRIGLDIVGPGSLGCHTTSIFDDPVPTQAYDTPLSSGPITCVINEQTGVTCRDSSTGHFFQIAQQAYQVG